MQTFPFYSRGHAVWQFFYIFSTTCFKKKDNYAQLLVKGKPFLILGATDDKVNPLVGILRSDEGKYVDGKSVAGRRMNGDQGHQGRHVRISTVNGHPAG